MTGGSDKRFVSEALRQTTESALAKLREAGAVSPAEPLQDAAPAPGFAGEPVPLYCPTLIKRSVTDGTFVHPHLPAQDDEDADVTPLVRAQGFEIRNVFGDSVGQEFPEDAAEDPGGDAYWKAMREWNPAPPDGAGWMLVAVIDAEDGPAAWFVRPLPATT